MFFLKHRKYIIPILLAAIAIIMVLYFFHPRIYRKSATMPLKDEILIMHNNERALLGLSPLEWDQGLEQFAVLDASQLATLNTLQHTRKNQNLHMSTKGYLNPSQMVQSWLNEKQYFVNGVFPNIAVSGKEWKDVGHYSQIIKRQAKRVGCAIADTTDGRNTILVCNYDYGNIWGETIY